LGTNNLDLTADRRRRTYHSYSLEFGGEVKMTKQEIIEMIHRAGFEAVERDTVYNRVQHALPI
jgi:2-iminoacetate synthase ThiH